MNANRRERHAEVIAVADEANATAKRILALLRQGEHDVGDHPDDGAAEALAPEDGAATR